jgi:hypothetical protein
LTKYTIVTIKKLSENEREVEIIEK